MSEVEIRVEQFFRTFERASDAGDLAALLPQFAETFLAAGPQGAVCVRAEDFAKVLPKRKQFFDALGCRATALQALEQHALDRQFVLAKTRWRMQFVQGEGESRDVVAHSVFIVDTAGQSPRIVFYLANQDHLAMLRENGILRE